MQITVLQENLKRGLSLAGHAVASKSTLPVLSNVLLDAKDGRLRLAATNLQIGITVDVGAKIEATGAVTLPFKLLSDVVSGLPNEPLTLTLDATTQAVSLQCGRVDATICGIEADEFPVIPSVTDAPQLSLPADVLKEAIQQVALAAATDDTRPVLAGVLMRVRGETLTLAAADGFRLAVKAIVIDPQEPFDVLVPARTLLELARTLDGGDVAITITPSGGQVCFKTDALEMVSRVIEGKFPDFERIIPAKFDTRTVLDTAALQKAVKLASYFATASANIVKLTIADGTLTICANATEIGDNESVVDALVDGDGGQIAVNVKFLQEALSTIGTKQVVLETQTPQSPLVLKPVGVDGYTHICMPMTVR